LEKEEKGVDFKIKISDDLLSWFLRESEAFYLLINDENKVLSFSENSLIFFSLKSNYEVGKTSISDLIGTENWQFLSMKINNFPENTEDSLILPEQVNYSYILGAKWKSYTDDDKKRIFIIFKHIIQKKEEEPKLELLVSEEEKKINCYKECFDQLDNPIAIFENKNFFYKNLSFENFFKDNQFENLDSFLNFVKKYSIHNELNIENITTNIKTKIKINENNYLLNKKNLPIDNQLSFVSISKVEKEIEVIEEEQTDQVIENKIVQENEIEKLKNQLDNIKLELKNEYENIIQNFNIDLENINTNISKNYDEYEKIITLTSENILSITHNFNFIEDLSVKIHLISINAAIESAKSGEHGKGFSVIAKEIAKLSTDIKQYIKKIGTQIETIKEYTQKITVKEKDSESPKKINSIKKIIESTKSKFTDITHIIIERINKVTLNE
jgi:hypothetical protein